jgi:hypothetical protein
MVYLKEDCKLSLTTPQVTQIKNFRCNHRMTLPSHELGISSWATALSIAGAADIHAVLSKPGATVHSAGVIGNAARSPRPLTLGP